MRISKILSIVFHPAFMPTFTCLLLFYSVPILRIYYAESIKMIISQIFLFTFVLPVLSVFFLKKIGYISTIVLERKEERQLPLIMSASFYLFLLFKNNSDPLLSKLILGGLLLLLLAILISKEWKISLHMMGIGGLTGTIFVIQNLFESPNLVLLSFLILCSGFVGFARVNEKAHNLQQVYIGFLIGFLTEFFVFY